MSLRFERLADDAAIRRAAPLMTELRGDMIVPERFVADVRAQEAQGYRLYGAFQDDALVALAGVRSQRTLSRGWHLFVDDLVTREDARGSGVGRAFLAFLDEIAAEEGLPAIYLDSRATARGFYERLGFTFLTAIPCFRPCRTV